MPGGPTENGVGLRERKKRQTRATLIDAAVRLCLEQGYANTTVEQIAAVADVSPRTFSRYFATKDAVMMTLLDGLVEAVAVELAGIPADVPALEAMRRAHVDVLARVPSGRVDGVSSESIRLMLRIINSTPELKMAANEFRPVSMAKALSARLDLDPGDRKLELIIAVWTAIMITACGDLGANPDGPDIGAEIMVDRIEQAFDQFTALTAELPRRSAVLGG